MSKLFSWVATGYAVIGSAVAVIFGASYFVGAYWAGGLWAMFSMDVFWLTWAIPLRGVFWLPTLTIWYFSGNPITFWEWLAPGLATSQV